MLYHSPTNSICTMLKYDAHVWAYTAHRGRCTVTRGRCCFLCRESPIVAVLLKYRSNAHDVVEGTYADDPGPIGLLSKLRAVVKVRSPHTSPEVWYPRRAHDCYMFFTTSYTPWRSLFETSRAAGYSHLGSVVWAGVGSVGFPTRGR